MKKIISFVLLSVFALSIGGFIGIQKAEAQSTISFPDGCGSALGYSATTGEPCNGTSTATPKFMSGCDTALGYSATTGEPCSGGSLAIQWLAGCTSTMGYSAESGEPCNGTLVATIAVVPPIAPGLPSTGKGGNAIANILLLASFGILGVLGVSTAINRRAHYEQ